MLTLPSLFKHGSPPVCDDGSLALVFLDMAKMESRGIEYYGDPIIVSRWSAKLKTTWNLDRLSYDDVIAYIELEVEAKVFKSLAKINI